MFEEFSLKTIKLDSNDIRLRIGGEGPPLLLLHGNPQTHVMWHAVAPKLSQYFTVIATDLTGYGESYKPESTPEHEAFSKRAMALDQIEVMKQLGFERFAVAGHDRGGRVAYRMALDHPSVVSKLAVLDIIPTLESFQRSNTEFGLGYYHWFFLAQPSPLPETLINHDPEWFWRWHTNRVPRKFFTDEAIEDYLRCFKTRRRCDPFVRTTVPELRLIANTILRTKKTTIKSCALSSSFGASKPNWNNGTTRYPYGENGQTMLTDLASTVDTTLPKRNQRKRPKRY